MHTICRYALLDRNIDQIVARDTRRVVELFEYITTHRSELMEDVREADSQRADEVVAAFQSEERLAKALWPKLQRIVAFGAGECYIATTRMKQFTGSIPHNNGFYYTEETIYGRAVADESDVFETVSSGSFHEYLSMKGGHATIVLCTDAHPGQLYHLVVTNNAGLYRYVTDHVVCINETQMDRVLFTIY